MKNSIIFFILILTFLVSTKQDLFATTLVDYVTVLENISETCQHGRQIIFRDSNEDGFYDIIRQTNCDGTYAEAPMTVSGNGSFARIGARADYISGSFASGSYVIRIYFPSDNFTLGYVEKKTSDPIAVFTFN
jgi:hypothetical protein